MLDLPLETVVEIPFAALFVKKGTEVIGIDKKIDFIQTFIVLKEVTVLHLLPTFAEHNLGDSVRIIYKKIDVILGPIVGFKPYSMVTISAIPDDLLVGGRDVVVSFEEETID